MRTLLLFVLLLSGCAKEIGREETGREDHVSSVSCRYSCFRLDCGQHYDWNREKYVYRCEPEYSCPGHRDAKQRTIHYIVWYDDETKRTQMETTTLAFLSECK